MNFSNKSARKHFTFIILWIITKYGCCEHVNYLSSLEQIIFCQKALLWNLINFNLINWDEKGNCWKSRFNTKIHEAFEYKNQFSDDYSIFVLQNFASFKCCVMYFHESVFKLIDWMHGNFILQKHFYPHQANNFTFHIILIKKECQRNVITLSEF